LARQTLCDPYTDSESIFARCIVRTACKINLGERTRAARQDCPDSSGLPLGPDYHLPPRLLGCGASPRVALPVLQSASSIASSCRDRVRGGCKFAGPPARTTARALVRPHARLSALLLGCPSSRLAGYWLDISLPSTKHPRRLACLPCSAGCGRGHACSSRPGQPIRTRDPIRA